MPANSSSPCMVPSSPYSPWSSGKTTSSSSFSTLPSSLNTSKALSFVSGEITAFTLLSFQAPLFTASTSGTRSHSPSLLITIILTSYLSVSMASITLAPLTRETSCSLERPPITTASLVFMSTSFPFLPLSQGLPFQPDW